MTYMALAPVFRGDGRIEFSENTYADPGEGQLLLRVQANAICGTDRAQYFGGSEIVPGHEAAGAVIATGPGTTIEPGTRGVVFLMDYCSTCRSCKIGATNQCLAKRADMGFTHDGGYGPYELVHQTNFFPVTDDIDLVEATMLLDVMGTSGHAIKRAELVRPDIEKAYVAGAGPIGLGILVMLKLRYGHDFPVYISDVSQWRLDYAETFGGISVKASEAEALARIPRPDVAFDSSGKQVARQAALDILGQRGALVCVGHGEGLNLDVTRNLLKPEGAVLGSEYFKFDEFYENLCLLRRNREYVSRVISHRFPVQDLGAAFELFLSGETGKVIVTQDVLL